MWSGKALATGAYTATKLGQAFTNLSAPIMGELYLDFSYFGAVVGYFYKKADTLFAAALAFGGVSLYRILTALICGFTIILMRGALSPSSPRSQRASPPSPSSSRRRG